MKDENLSAQRLNEKKPSQPREPMILDGRFVLFSLWWSKMWGLLRSGFSEARQGRTDEAGRNRSGDLDHLTFETFFHPTGREVKKREFAHKDESVRTLSDVIAKGKLHYYEGKSFRRWSMVMRLKYGAEVVPHLQDAWKIIEEVAKVVRQPEQQSQSSTLYREVAPGKFEPVKPESPALRFYKRLRNRKIIVALAAVAFTLAGLFPPWLNTFTTNAGLLSRWDAGYSFILSPPPPKKTAPYWGAQLDMTRLLVEWSCIFVAGSAAWFLFRAPRHSARERQG
jgi:hypothetical protein